MLKGKSNVNLVTLLDFVNLFFAGMLAGIEFVIHYGLRGPSEVLDEHSHAPSSRLKPGVWRR